MAARTIWKGFLALARVSAPVRMHLAVTRNDGLGFKTVNRTTLNPVEMRPFDPQTKREVGRGALVHGYEVEPGRFILVEDRELAEIEIDSSRTITLERFIEPTELDIAYIDQPFFLVPDGGEAPFAVIHEAISRAKRIGLGRLVLAHRERAVVVMPRGRGMLLVTLRAAHEVRTDEPIFASMRPTVPDPAMVDLASDLLARRHGHFDPKRDFRDRYQEALFELVQAKLKGEKPVLPKRPAPRDTSDLRAALEASLAE
ncbi:MAG TPA: Ku protein [Stellaceae bacterium]|nr:Ku protein [Stellaceae bacterium]